MNILGFFFPDSTPIYYVSMLFGNSALLSILGSRMMFNLKEAGELGVNGGTNYRPSLSGTLSGPEFA